MMIFALSSCHGPIHWDVDPENQHFFALRVRISAPNLDWKLVRGSATKISWSLLKVCLNLDDAPCSVSVVEMQNK